MSKLQQVVKDFHTNLISFLDELIEQFPSEADLILIRLFAKDTIQPTLIIHTFIKEILPYKDIIAKRDDTFFLDDNISIFSTLDKTKVNHFKVLWKSSTLDDDDRQIIWKWFDTFIFLVEQYQQIKLN
jgi:hypothetical protein